MERISLLLDEVGYGLDTEFHERVFRWATEVTNRIQELDYRSQKMLDSLDDIIDALRKVTGEDQ